MATYESKKYAIPIEAPNIADGTVNNTEFQRLDGVTSDIQTQLDSKLASAGAFTVQTGMILPFSAAAASIPTGYLNCDGAAVSRTTHSTLFNLIGVSYGSGNGSTTFNVPNLSGRMPIGKSGTYALGSTGGATTSTATISGSVSVTVNNHTLTVSEIPSHNHLVTHAGGGISANYFHPTYGASIPFGDNNTSIPTNPFYTYPSACISNTGGGAGHNHTASGSFGGAQDTFSILNPYLSVNFIIKT